MSGVLPTGAVPGSVWLPGDTWYREESQLLLPPKELQALVADAAIDSGNTIIVYGRFGVDTALAWAVLTALGYEDVRIYDQGWATWAPDGDTSNRTHQRPGTATTSFKGEPDIV